LTTAHTIHRLRRSLAPGFAAVALACSLHAEETNAWPFKVEQHGATPAESSWTAAGPFLFDQPAREPGRISGFRPFYVKRTDADGATVETTVLYPLFYYRNYSDTYEWSVFKLLNRSGRAPAADAASAGTYQTFDVWPFYFSRDNGNPATSYRALLPIYGTVKERLGYDRLSWVALPFYGQAEQKGWTTTATPWPFIRTTTGSETGFAFWPLFGWRDRPGEFHREYYLWPLVWNNTTQPDADAPAGTPASREIGVLPFYTRSSRADAVSENFLWPFFGDSDRAAPNRYHETRWFWPFFVQGHGTDANGMTRDTNRWGPFYTHSNIKGVDKTWIAWPLWRQAHWTDGNIAQTKTQFLWLLYWSQEQRSLTNPAAASAVKTHMWPLLSAWDNGAGRRQFQLFSPIDPLFTDNPRMKAAWSPLFAIYRYEQTTPGDQRTSVLWNAVTWEKHTTDGQSAFHLGPLLGIESDRGKDRVSLFGGLLGAKRTAADGRWRVFWLDFPQNSATPSPAPR